MRAAYVTLLFLVIEFPAFVKAFLNRILERDGVTRYELYFKLLFCKKKLSDYFFNVMHKIKHYVFHIVSKR